MRNGRNPERQRVIVHRLEDDQYVINGEYGPGNAATSALLDGFRIDVATLFAAADDVPN